MDSSSYNRNTPQDTTLNSPIQDISLNSSNLSYSQQIQQQHIDASPISTQINKMLKKNKKDNEKKMLLNDEDFN